MTPHLCSLFGLKRVTTPLDARDHEDAAEMYVEGRWGRQTFGRPRRVRVWVAAGAGAARLFNVKVRPGRVFDCTGEIGAEPVGRGR